MTRGWTRRLRIALGVVLATLPAACLAATAGGATVSAVTYTERGARSIVTGSPAEVTERTRAVLARMGARMEGAEGAEGVGGEEVRMKGVLGDRGVAVGIRRESPTGCEVQVSVRQGALQRDRELAKRILERIVEGS